MPTYTQPLLDHITTAALDWWMNKGTAFQEAIQEKPLLAIDGEQEENVSRRQGQHHRLRQG
jgi:hypothetical protein